MHSIVYQWFLNQKEDPFFKNSHHDPLFRKSMSPYGIEAYSREDFETLMKSADYKQHRGWIQAAFKKAESLMQVLLTSQGQSLEDFFKPGPVKMPSMPWSPQTWDVFSMVLLSVFKEQDWGAYFSRPPRADRWSLQAQNHRLSPFLFPLFFDRFVSETGLLTHYESHLVMKLREKSWVEEVLLEKAKLIEWVKGSAFNSLDVAKEMPLIADFCERMFQGALPHEHRKTFFSAADFEKNMQNNVESLRRIGWEEYQRLKPEIADWDPDFFTKGKSLYGWSLGDPASTFLNSKPAYISEAVLKDLIASCDKETFHRHFKISTDGHLNGSIKEWVEFLSQAPKAFNEALKRLPIVNFKKFNVQTYQSTQKNPVFHVKSPVDGFKKAFIPQDAGVIGLPEWLWVFNAHESYEWVSKCMGEAQDERLALFRNPEAWENPAQFEKIERKVAQKEQIALNEVVFSRPTLEASNPRHKM